MRLRAHANSPGEKILAYKLDPGVFVVEVPEAGRRISLGQPPDAVKRLQQAGYSGPDGVTTFVVVDSKRQGDSIAWNLVEFPILYALYFIPAEVNGKRVPAFYAGRRPTLVGLERDVQQAMRMIKYGNYGVDSLEELDALDVPAATRDALRSEVLGLAVGNEVKNSDSFIDPVYLDPAPRREEEFSDLGDGVRIGRVGHNTYRFVYGGESVEVDVSLQPGEQFRSPVEYKHLKFPVMSFGIWHTGEYDGMDPFYSCAHTTIIHKYEPILVDYPSNMTDIINHHGLSKQSINKVLVTHNHDDHIGAVVELFRRSEPCHIITTDPVRFSLVKKLSALVDLPERVVEESFRWTLLPFRRDNPYRTEDYNLDGLRITGHLSCHSVPTTVYTFHINEDGYEYNYGHFLDIVAFKRMERMVEDGWMPEKHLGYLNHVVRETSYNLIKYDAGCTSDAALAFTVHGQWQDLKGSATERPYRVFTHATKDHLDPAYENEGRFVTVGDLDSTLRHSDGRLIRLGGEKRAITSFFSRAYDSVLAYFQSLVDAEPGSHLESLMRHYAMAFANCSKQPDLNIGAFLFEQGQESHDALVIVRGRAEILMHSDDGDLVFRSVVGDVGVIAHHSRMASVKSLNRMSYLSVPGNLFLEAMHVLGVRYEGYFRELFDRRLLFQSAWPLAQDLSTLMLNRIAKHSRTVPVKKGQPLFEKGQRDARLIAAPGGVAVKDGRNGGRIAGPAVHGECEFLLHNGGEPPQRLFTAVAEKAMDVLELSYDEVAHVPVLADNIRRIVAERRERVYPDMPPLLPENMA